MYKMSWIFDHLPSHLKKHWDTARNLCSALEKEPDFYVGSQCCHMKAALEKFSHPDKTARVLVDHLLSRGKASFLTKYVVNIF